MSNLKKNFSFLLLAIISFIIVATNIVHIDIIFAALAQDHVEQLREMLKNVASELQNNSTNAATSRLQTIISNITQHVCNMAVCNIPGGSIQTDTADNARIPLKDALKAIQDGNTTLAQNQIRIANSSFNTLS